MCRVPNCNACKPGYSHYCQYCENKDTKHRSANCLLTIKRCKVVTCIKCKLGHAHACKNCGNTDVNHHTKNCTLSRSNSFAGLYIFWNNLLLVCRTNVSSRRGQIDTVGGSIDYKESVYNGVLREAKEECGLDIMSPLVPFLWRGRLVAYYTVLNSKPNVTGPMRGFENEVQMNSNLADSLGVSPIGRTGFCWAPIQSILYLMQKENQTGIVLDCLNVLKNISI